ncbi:MAG: hypothetical protein K2X57_06665 [Xanthobacteraceae bacterium]|nr:hypothetical protein [Xanthobacteraceae bacterium]
MPGLQKPHVFGEHDVIAAERKHIEVGRPGRLGAGSESMPWCGIGLSGGGIRSASFALGVLQGFASQGLLKRFDYMSSVSGGGYIAASLQWWWRGIAVSGGMETGFGTGRHDFPYGSALDDSQSENLSERETTEEKASRLRVAGLGKRNLEFLRSHAAYLTPGDGLNAWSMLGVLVRTIVVSLLTWIPLLVFAFLLISELAITVDVWPGIVKLGLPLPDWLASPRWSCTLERHDCALKYPAVFALLLYALYAVAVAFAVLAVIFAGFSRTPENNIPVRFLIRLLVGSIIASGIVIAGLYGIYDFFNGTIIAILIAMMVNVVVAVFVLALIAWSPPGVVTAYWARRTLERAMGGAFLPFLVLLAFATVPIVPSYLVDKMHNATSGTATATATGFLGLAGLLGGVLSSLYGYYVFLKNAVPSLAAQIAATVGSFLYIYMTVVVSYALSVIFFYPRLLSDSDEVALVQVPIIVSVLISACLGFLSNINLVGLHRFYRDRLMEAFMPTKEAVDSVRSGFSQAADSLSIAKLTSGSYPYPLINTNVILVNDKDRKVSARGGDNFILSPLFIGSKATEWQSTDDYIATNGTMTLASSVAASGAAVSASAGYIGTGLTMNRIVSTAMSLLNIRLGLWVGNPNTPAPRGNRTFLKIPTFFNPGLAAGILGMAHKRTSPFLELTDGGHFENLALYELVRRRLDVIVIVDGEADPKISLRSLVSATRRIEEDFGATLELYRDPLGPDRLVMKTRYGYPSEASYARSPFIVGKLLYSPDDHGVRKHAVLIYVKATNVEGLDFVTSGYLAANPEFPHQSTIDQFFGPDQFDAYHHLGHQCASMLIRDLDLPKSIETPDGIIRRYTRPGDQLTT